MTTIAVEPERTTTPPSRHGRRRISLRRVLTRSVFVGTVLIGAMVVKTHPPQYASSGTVVIVGSETIAQREARSDEKVNAASQSVLARFGNPTVVGDIFARIYSSWAKQTALKRAGLHGRLDVTTRTSIVSFTPDHGPVIVFTVFSATPQDAQRGVTLVIADLQRELARWQQGADPALSVSDATITPPEPGLLASGSKPRSAVAVIAFAGLLAWTVGELDRARARWRRRRLAAML